jgi:dTDP-4-amino-4,6-dideoxygalactose transaminase
VGVKLHYPIAIHQQKGFPWKKKAVVKKVPNCEKNAAQCLSLPIFPELTDEEVDYTVAQLVAWDKANGKKK